MRRPSVDVVVPFRGPPAELKRLCTSLAALRLAPEDSVVIVDNTPGSASAPEERDGVVSVVCDDGVAAPGYARNRGAARGRAEWLLFVDADTQVAPDLLDRYFDPPPGQRTALLAGGVRDRPVGSGSAAVARYAYVNAAMSQDNTLFLGGRPFPQTANAACRRAAFESVGGFREDIRAGEDADLAYRLEAAGWRLERREQAAVVHCSRQSVLGFVVQKALHGAAAAWLDREHPGSQPARGRAGLLWWAVRRAGKGLVQAMRTRDRDEALRALLHPLEQLSYELGRSLPNERPLAERSLWARLARLGGSP